jgi:UDP-GlcNAc:undecaprenyl-phosphate GlcNAc-1-phosphate transferase
MDIISNNTYYSVYIIHFIFSFLFSFLLNKVLLKFSKNLGRRNEDESMIRWSSTTKPALGGISFFISFLLSSVVYSIVFEGGGEMYNTKFLGFITATSLAFMMGLADDAYNTKPLLKLLSQMACGVILVISGTSINLFPSDIANNMLTIFWVVGMMNSINMLDNMDGITTTVSIFIVLSAILSIALFNQYSDLHILLLLGVLGGLLGFLFYNWNPSKMYMGDTGSQFLGFFLAAIGITYFWNNKGVGGDEAQTKQIIITILAFIIPIIDTTTVTINRLKRGQAPYIGGKDHTTHHLSYLGLTDRQVALFFALISLISFIFIFIIIDFIDNWNYTYTILFSLYIILLFVGLYSVTMTKKAKERLNAK